MSQYANQTHGGGGGGQGEREGSQSQHQVFFRSVHTSLFIPLTIVDGWFEAPSWIRAGRACSDCWFLRGIGLQFAVLKFINQSL